jgi:hypothetical protein
MFAQAEMIFGARALVRLDAGYRVVTAGEHLLQHW